ncbi:hypothetical protein OIU79_010999, partial [Salix purpurea]
MPRPGVAWRNWLVSIGCFLHSSLLLKNSPVDPNGFPITLSLSLCLFSSICFSHSTLRNSLVLLLSLGLC